MFKISTPRNANLGVDYTHIVYDHNSPLEYARELFKPSKDS